jgi:hypothetical protein
VVTTTPPLVTVTGVGVGVVDVDGVVPTEVLEVELLDWVVALLDETELVACVEDEAEVVTVSDVIDVEEVEDEVGEILLVGAVDVLGAETAVVPPL